MHQSTLLAASLLLCLGIVHGQVYFDPSATTSWNGGCGSCPVTAPCNFGGATTLMSSLCNFVFLAGNTSYTKSLFIVTGASGVATMSSSGDARFSSSASLTFSFGYMGLVLDGFTSTSFPDFRYVSYQGIAVRNSNLTLTSDFSIAAGGSLTVSNSYVGSSSSSREFTGNGNGFTFTVTDSTIKDVSFAGSGLGSNSLTATRSYLSSYIYSRFTSVTFIECVISRPSNLMATGGDILPVVSFQKSVVSVGEALFLDSAKIASLEIYRSNVTFGQGIGSNLDISSSLSIQRSNVVVQSGSLFKLGTLTATATNPNMSITIVDSSLTGSTVTTGGFMSVSGTRQVLLTFQNSPVSLPSGASVWALPVDVNLVSNTHFENIMCGTVNATVISGSSVELSGKFSCPSSNGQFTLNTESALLNNGLNSPNNDSMIVNTTLVYHVTDPSLGGVSVFPTWTNGFSISWSSDLALPSVGDTVIFVNSSYAIPYIGTEFDVDVGWQDGQTNVTFNQVACNSGCVEDHMSTSTCVSNDRCSCTAPWGGPLCDCDLSVVGSSCNPLPPSYPPDQHTEAPVSDGSGSNPSTGSSPSSPVAGSGPTGSRAPTGAASHSVSSPSVVIALVSISLFAFMF